MKKGMLVLVASTLVTVFGPSAAGDGLQGPGVGQRLPQFFLPVLNPDASNTPRVVLSSLLEKSSTKALLVVVFDADCEPCQKLLPELGKFHQEHSGDGFVVIGVDCDSKSEKIEQVKRNLKDMKITFPVVADRFLALSRRYGIKSYPTMFIAGADGKLVLRQEGYHPEKKPLPVRKLLELLGLRQGDG